MLFSLAIDLSRDFTRKKHLDNRTIYTEQHLVLKFLFFLYIFQSDFQYPKCTVIPYETQAR